MGEVYSAVWWVLVWLGERDEDIDFVMDKFEGHVGRQPRPTVGSEDVF
jgi:hypothetical protein